MREPPIYALKGAALAFGNNQLFRNVEFYINRGDKISLVGRNGCGKSTLLKVIAGVLEPDQGETFIQPGLKISYMPQDPDFSSYKTLKDVVLDGLPANEHGLDYKADILIEQFGIVSNQDPLSASGGERRKAALAKALINDPDILLLDEPTNHLDLPTIEKLEKIIAGFRGAVILISHDRMFLNNTSQTTFWLDRGIMHCQNKGFKYFEEWQEQIINQELCEQHNLNKKIEDETEWLHKGVTARRKRNMGRLRKLQQLRIERKEQIKQTGNINLAIDEGDFRSKLVIEAKHIQKCFNGREIVRDFSTRIIKGNKIGIVGPNGAGKTTLIKLLTKRLEPDSGSVRIGKNLEEAYFDQNRIALDPKKTLWQTLCDKGDHILVQGQFRHVVAYLKDFLFRPDQAHCPVAALSGGEKNRLMLALALAQPSNFLVLDEPTNDLDMDTLDLLQEVLAEYAGTALVVSHDRDFIDRVVSSIIYMKGDGTVNEYAGSYSDLIAKLAEEENTISAAKAQKKRINPAKKSQPNLRAEQTAKSYQNLEPITATSNGTEAVASVLNGGSSVIIPKKETAPKKLSYKQQRLLEVLPQEISDLEQQIFQTEEKLSDPSFYSRDPQGFEQLTHELTAYQTLKEEKENQWLEIQLLKEELETA